MGHHTKKYTVAIKINCICLYLVIQEKSAICWQMQKASYRTATCGKFSLRKSLKGSTPKCMWWLSRLMDL